MQIESTVLIGCLVSCDFHPVREIENRCKEKRTGKAIPLNFFFSVKDCFLSEQSNEAASASSVFTRELNRKGGKFVKCKFNSLHCIENRIETN